METLVFRCQHTCTMVLPRCGAWRSSDVREALRSSSDSWSAATASSGDSARGTEGVCDLAPQGECPFPATPQEPDGTGGVGGSSGPALGPPCTHQAGTHASSPAPVRAAPRGRPASPLPSGLRHPGPHARGAGPAWRMAPVFSPDADIVGQAVVLPRKGDDVLRTHTLLRCVCVFFNIQKKSKKSSFIFHF